MTVSSNPTLSRSTATKLRVLMAGGDPTDRTHIRSLLRANGRDVTEVDALDEVLRELQDVHAILLHVGTAEGEGWSLLETLAQEWPATPVVVVGLTDATNETLRAFELGADDFVARGADPAIVAARLNVALRRFGHDQVLVFSDLTVNLHERAAYVADRRLRLTALEFDVLALMATQPMRLWTREELLCAVWTDAEEVMDRTVDVRIRRLRASLGDDAARPRFIETVRGRGYRWVWSAK